jgi:hypothetical protein
MNAREANQNSESALSELMKAIEIASAENRNCVARRFEPHEKDEAETTIAKLKEMGYRIQTREPKESTSFPDNLFVFVFWDQKQTSPK